MSFEKSPLKKNMATLRKQFIEDSQERKIAVLLPIYQHNKMQEEIDSVKAYDNAKAEEDEIIPFD